MTPRVKRLSDGHEWLRVADPDWVDPLDPSFAAERGGRWNPPGSHPTLYLNEDIATARSQVEKLLEGSPIGPDDLDPGFDLVVATLPRSQDVADAISDEGLESLELPVTYPRYGNGRPIQHEVCQTVGVMVHDVGLRGVHARSAADGAGLGRELAWFPARTTSRASQVSRFRFEDWWYRP
ncbi:MAG TPA: RES family NAD+ phosphorylase [Acidimicrobiia bacterium]